MNQTVIVCVSRCNEAGTHAYQSVSRSTYNTLPFAKLVGDMKRAPGLSVLVRPNYNETDENGMLYYREWLSMNGGPWVERVFKTKLKAA